MDAGPRLWGEGEIEQDDEKYEKKMRKRDIRRSVLPGRDSVSWCGASNPLVDWVSVADWLDWCCGRMLRWEQSL